jgi:PEGA domain
MRHRLASMTVISVIWLVLVGTPGRVRAERAILVVGGAALKSGHRADLVAASKAALDVAGWALVDPSAELESRVLLCVEQPTARCLGPMLDQASADRAVVIRVTSEDPKDRGKLQVRGWVFRSTGELLVGGNQECSACRTEHLRDIVSELTASMVQRARARTRPATLVIRSIPEGATIYIDDHAVGATEFSYGVYAGKHTVRLKRDGYHDEVREVSVTDGEKVPLDVELRPIAGAGSHGAPRRDPRGDERPEPLPPPPRSSRLLPWLTVSAGAAVALAGVGVLLLEESDAPTGDKAVERRETTLVGLSITGAGVVTVSVGLVWLVRSGRTSRVSPRPTAGASSGGAWLGLAGQF